MSNGKVINAAINPENIDEITFDYTLFFLSN